MHLHPFFYCTDALATYDDRQFEPIERCNDKGPCNSRQLRDLANYDVHHLVSCAVRLHDAVRPTIRELRPIAYETICKRAIVHLDSVALRKHARVLARR